MALVEPKLQKSTFSKMVDETVAASWAPYELGRRAVSTPRLEWSAVQNTKTFCLNRVDDIKRLTFKKLLT